MTSPSSYTWHFIQDYENLDNLLRQKSELRELSEIWQEQKENLRNAEELHRFNERMRREWAIETGLLERIYTLDRGVTQILIERGIDASLIPSSAADRSPEKVITVLRDHEAAIDSLFVFVTGERELSTSYIKELHALLTRNQPTTTAVDTLGTLVEIELRHGAYKIRSNNPTRPDGSIHEYCPPEHVDSEMEKLIDLHQNHNMPPEIEAAWLHHRFTQIHPFQDGNGRVARCLATLVFLKAGWFPLVIRDTVEERSRYIDALESADNGNLTELIALFTNAQKKAFVQALGISSQVLRKYRAEQVIAAIKDKLIARDEERTAEWQQAKNTALALLNLANNRFNDISETLKQETTDFFNEDANFFVNQSQNGEGKEHYFRWQLITVAQKLGYFFDHKEYHSWVRLVLRVDGTSNILISFHGSGHEFRGILATSACYFRQEEVEGGQREVVDVIPLSTDIFQINYKENLEDTAARFEIWLEDVLVKGLELWRKSI